MSEKEWKFNKKVKAITSQLAQLIYKMRSEMAAFFVQITGRFL